MTNRDCDAWTVGGAALAVVALLIGCACGIAIDRSATVATYPPVARLGCYDSPDGVRWRPAPCVTPGGKGRR